jgi:hypothetical protein
MKRLFLLLSLGCAASLTERPTVFASPITVAPGLYAGEHYRLAFVTSTSTSATSSSIAYYNAFVTEAANLDPALESLGTTWTAIASTSTVTARDNTDTNPSSVGFPIYNLAGQLIATSNANLWDGSISSSISYDEHGVPTLPGYTEIWTGTGSTGVPDDPNDTLGNPLPAWGDTMFATSRWIDTGGYYEASGHHTLYAISGVLTAAITVVPGDLNGDGIVNAQDLELVASHWLQTGTNVAGDANGDGIVNGGDLRIIDANWLKNASGSTGGGTSVAAVVPEPATIVMVALGGLALLAWRWRH